MIKISKSIGIIILLLCIFFLTGCGNKKEESIKIVKDMAGFEVEIPNEIKNVACINPSATDMLIAFGGKDYIKGTYRTFLDNNWVFELCPESKSWESFSYSVSIEELLAKEINLVICPDEGDAEVFRNAGMPVVIIRQYVKEGSFEDSIFECARILGEIFGGVVKENADKWTSEVKAVINEVSKKLENQPQKEETVYFINGEKNKGLFYSDGGKSMISYLLQLEKYKLATEDYKVETVHNTSEEEMLNINPDNIIIGGVYQNTLKEQLLTDTLWSKLDAVKNNKVYNIPIGMVSWENISIETQLMIKYLSNIYYPELFDFDIERDTIDAFSEWYGYTLTKEQVGYMLQGLSFDGKALK